MVRKIVERYRIVKTIKHFMSHPDNWTSSFNDPYFNRDSGVFDFPASLLQIPEDEQPYYKLPVREFMYIAYNGVNYDVRRATTEGHDLNITFDNIVAFGLSLRKAVKIGYNRHQKGCA